MFQRFVLVLIAVCVVFCAGCDGKKPKTAKPSSPASQADGELPKDESATDPPVKSAAGSPELSSDWPMERGNVASSGAYANSVGDEFEIDWEFKYPKGAFESGPIIVTVEGKPTVFVAGIDINVHGKIYSIDLESGEANWEFEIKEGFVAAPAFRDGKLFVGDMAGMIYCVDAKYGKEVWKYETKAQISSSGNFYKSLVLFGSEDATLYAIDRDSGKLKWSHSIEDQIQCGATVAGDRCFLAGCDAKLHIVGLDDGKEIDAIEIGSPTGTTAAAFGDNVFFGTEQGTFFSIDFPNPKINWDWQEDTTAVSIRSSAAVTETNVVFGARNRRVNCLDPKTGERKWSAKVKAKVDGSPVIAGDRVYAGSTDGRLYVLDLLDGKELWQQQFNGAFLGSPAIIGGERPRLVVATERGTVYSLKPVP